MTSPERTRALHAGWSVREADAALGDAANFRAADGWIGATVPGTVYQDLIESGRIPDPYVGRNEQQVQWVAESAWCYRTEFDIASEDRRAQMHLVFDGLDTFAQVWLNGELVLTSDNMFVPARIDVTARLRDGRNELWIRFDGALQRGRALESHHGKRALWNGDSSRLYVRKAGYHYGWDWGPVLLTAGPWKAISLQAFDARIAEVHSPVWLADDLQRARVDVHTAIDGPAAGLTLRQVLRDARGTVVAEAEAPADLPAPVSLEVVSPELWWPAGHGAQPLYELTTELRSGTTVVARQQRRLGLRRVRLLQQPVAGEAGRSFHFEVNGREIFIGGANWIPDDNLLNRITPARYRERVAQAAAANLTMLRVWGGGIYEDDAFYDACDELGILVWQDFLFACGLYPAHAAFRASVEAEARAAVTRLRHRASLALWCGNNEDYTLAEQVGVYGPGKDLARFDARVLYEELLPAVCAELDPGRAYWPGSPYSSTTEGQLNSQDPTVGDRHSWEVWHQLMLPYAQYAKVGARFVSEFGMQSHPSMAVLEAAIPADDRFPGSATMQWHNKANAAVIGPDGHRRLAVYIADNLRHDGTLAGEVYATQFIQAEAMRHAYEAFRRRWQRAGARGCGGALVWQLNDCWPVTSWAIVDSGAHAKPAWFAIRRALAPLACALRVEAGVVSAWACNGRSAAVTVRSDWRAHALDGTLLAEQSGTADLASNASVELAVPAAFAKAADASVLSLTLTAADGSVTRATAWPEPFRCTRFPDPQVAAVAEAPGVLVLSAQRPAKGVWLAAPGAHFDENFVDLLPGQPLHVAYRGSLDGLAVASLNLIQDPRP